MVNLVIRWLYSITIGFVFSIIVHVFGSFSLLIQDDPSILEGLAPIANLYSGPVEKVPRETVRRDFGQRIVMFFVGYIGGFFMLYFSFLCSLFFAVNFAAKIQMKIPRLFYPIHFQAMLGTELEPKPGIAPPYTGQMSPYDSRTYDPQSTQQISQVDKITNTIRCNACGTPNQSGEFCMECGTRLSVEDLKQDFNKKSK